AGIDRAPVSCLGIGRVAQSAGLKPHHQLEAEQILRRIAPRANEPRSRVADRLPADLCFAGKARACIHRVLVGLEFDKRYEEVPPTPAPLAEILLLPSR